MGSKRVEVPKITLIKELKSDENLCDHCRGTGIILDVKEQIIKECPYCNHGVINVCPYCGRVLGKDKICRCDGYVKHMEDRYKRVCDVHYKRAKKMTYDEYEKEYPGHMVFCEDDGEYYCGLDDLIDVYESECLDIPKYIYGTLKYSINLDVFDILEKGCKDLYGEICEDVMYSLVGIDELKEDIDKFNIKNKETSAIYYKNPNVVIIL